MSNNFKINIKPFVNKEIEASNNALIENDLELAFTHLERAHVLGQNVMALHLKVHYLMFRWGMKRNDFREMLGQALRILGTILFTWLNRLPTGNTGGANVPPFRKMEIPKELKKIIEDASRE
jgi:hypothetical protein